VVAKQLQITGSYGGTPEDGIKGIEMIRDKKIDRSALISHEFPLGRGKDAFETACNVEESVKVQILP
jgi:threonine dehydrogenase-like Zn-dependent dehydrogenase